MAEAVKARRRPTPALILAGLGAAVAWAGLLPTWLTQTYGTDHAGRLARTGQQAAPSVLALVLLALAGVVAAYAVGGLGGRVISVVVAVAGAGLAAAVVLFVVTPPADAGGGSALPAPTDLMDAVVVHPAGPAVSALGGVMLLAAGALLVVRPPRRLARRYEAGAGPAPVVGEAGPAPDDADAAVGWWKALDRGLDPTDPRRTAP